MARDFGFRQGAKSVGYPIHGSLTDFATPPEAKRPVRNCGITRCPLSKLSEDIYRAAKNTALAEECSISVAVARLLRRGVVATEAETKKFPAPFPVVEGSRPFTSEDVYRADLP